MWVGGGEPRVREGTGGGGGGERACTEGKGGQVRGREGGCWRGGWAADDEGLWKGGEQRERGLVGIWQEEGAEALGGAEERARMARGRLRGH